MPVSRRSFLQLASSGLAVGALGLAPAAEAARRAAAAPVTAPAIGPVYLNFNECPHGPSPGAQLAASTLITRSGRYLFGLSDELTELFASQNGLPPDHVGAYAGSSDPLNRAARAFTSSGAAVVMADPTFEAVADVAAANGAPVRKVPLRSDGAHDVKRMAGIDPNAGLIYLCNPNNPTGSVTARKQVQWLLANKPTGAILLVDEAYIHYSEQPSVIDLVARHPDLLVLRTFSKLYGMAGLRLGLAVAAPPLLARLNAFGDNPLPITALAAGIASLRDPQLVPTRRAQNARIRNDTVQWLRRQGYSCLPSQANCFMVDVKRDGQDFAAAMAEQKVMVGRSWPIWPRRIRVTVGTEAEMLRFREAFSVARK